MTIESVSVEPLQGQDPRALGGVQITGRLATTESGIVYAGEIDGQPTAVVLLTEGAERDPYARARFETAQATLTAHRRTPVLDRGNDVDIAPWVAVPAETWERGLHVAEGLLASVALEDLQPVGRPQGPPFRPHWAPRRRVGRWRIWPLPWPATLSSASRWTYAAAFTLVVSLAALGLWIAVNIFQGQAPAPPSPGPGPLPISPPPTTSSPPPPTPSSPPPPFPRPRSTPVTTVPRIV